MKARDLAETIARRRADGRAAFIPFITAGDPGLKATGRFVRALAGAGADIIELGVPFSDPVADGPTIQAASQRALASGTTLGGVLALVKDLRAGGLETPIILFSYLNPVLRMGLERFAAAAGRSGVSAVLLVDLPAESAAPWSRALARRGVETVLLASPTTSRERLRRIGKASGSVVYYVSREGVTGARAGLPPGLRGRLDEVRALTGKPLIVGFGISTPEAARSLGRCADGVVVGSAMVAQVAGRGPALAEKALVRFTRKIVASL